MSISRESMALRLAELASAGAEHHSKYPGYPDHAVREMFMQGAVDHLSGWFDKHGWPEVMPAFTFLPPIETPKARAFIGYLVADEGGLWEMRQVDGKFTAVA